MCAMEDGRPRRLERIPLMLVGEVDRLMEEIAEIKDYVFCRLLLGHAVLLPAAMKASNLDEFFNGAEVKTRDLRDQCLRLE